MNVKTLFSVSMPGSRKRLLVLSPVILAAIAVMATGIAIGMLYRTSYEQQETRLVEIVEFQARLVEAIGRANDWNKDATLALVAEAQGNYKGLGTTGEFTLAHREGKDMRFLLHHRHGDSHSPSPVPFAGELAEPMRRSLQGATGTVVGLDYRGETVLAAYRPVGGLQWGIVAKIDLNEIRAPFVRTAAVVVVVVLVLVGCGSFLLVRLGTPVIAELDARNRDLLQERNRAQEYLDIAGVILIALDRDGNIALINHKGCELLGYAQEAIIGKNWFQLCLPERLRDEVHGVFRQLMAGNIKPAGIAENAVLARSGEERIIAWHNTILRNGEGEVVGTLSSGEDVTDRNLAAKERERLIGDLEAQNAELERFAYTVSHDLKSPLITIKGYLGMLEEDMALEDHAQAKDDMARIARAADKMGDLLNELLELSRIGRMMNPPEDVPLGPLVQDVLELNAVALAKREVEVVVPSDPPVLYGDPVRLREVVQNLVENAVKYMGNQCNPRIEIHAQGGKNEVVCRVSDNGLGVDPRFHEKIFGLFDKLDPETEGTGIGLALAKRIVEVHGGRIWIESEGRGSGSCFCFTLPSNGVEEQPLGGENHARRTARHPIG